MTRVLILVGSPGSGKSSFANALHNAQSMQVANKPPTAASGLDPMAAEFNPSQPMPVFTPRPNATGQRRGHSRRDSFAHVPVPVASTRALSEVDVAKSARLFAQQHLDKKLTITSALICSADKHFENNGHYQFDSRQLPQAHKSCMKAFVNAAVYCSSQQSSFQEDADPFIEFFKQAKRDKPRLRQPDYLIVDNTNTTEAELAPYIAITKALNMEYNVLVFQTSQFNRSLHNIDTRIVSRMNDNISGLLTAINGVPLWSEARMRLIKIDSNSGYTRLS